VTTVTWYNNWSNVIVFLLLLTQISRFQFNSCDLILMLIQYRLLWINIRHSRYMLIFLKKIISHLGLIL